MKKQGLTGNSQHVCALNQLCFDQLHVVRSVIGLPARNLRLRNCRRRALNEFVDYKFQRASDVRMQRAWRNDNHVFDCAELSKANGDIRSDQCEVNAKVCDLKASVAAAVAWLSSRTGMTQAQCGARTSKLSAWPSS